MIPNIRLVSNHDGTYDLLLDYPAGDVEFAEEFDIKRNIKSNSIKLSQTVLAYAKKIKIKSVRILVSGVLVATVAFSAFITAFAKTDRYTMGYLYGGTDHQQIKYVEQANNALDVVSPSYFDIREDGSLKLNYLSSYFIKTMHDKGVKVVPFLSNHWNRSAGINALKDVESLSAQIANYVEEYNLDGVNVDIENVTHEQKEQYTRLIKLLREKIPSEKEVSVAVAANPNDWQLGWHGSYDYTALAEYADHLMIMAYDEHHEGGEAGPVASIDFVENSIKYALSKTSSDKIVVGIPLYGRVWSLDDDSIIGKGIDTKTVLRILENCESTINYDEDTHSAKAEFTITEESGDFIVGGNIVLQPGNYVVWFENDESYQEKLSLIEKYNLKGAGAWSLGQEDTSIWEYYEGWINGEDEKTDEEDNYIYEVQAGDSLWKIAQRHLGAGNQYPVIMELSGLSDEKIYPGMHLKIPRNSDDGSSENTTGEYIVKPGDTLWKIAESQLGSGGRYTEIIEINKLKAEAIYPGLILKLPDK